MKVKVGDKFLVKKEWDNTITRGVVIKVHSPSFTILFNEWDERGPFFESEIGKIIEWETKLHRALE